MKKILKKQVNSFWFAIKGLGSILYTESHMRFHLVAALYVIYFGAKFYNLTSAQWTVLVLTICAVMIAEIFNTAIERVCDTITTQYSANIKFIKDTSAGAVLVTAIGAIAVAFIILFRPDVIRYSILVHFLNNITALVFFLLITAVAVEFVVIKPEKYINFIKSIKNKNSKINNTDNKNNTDQ